MELFQSKPKIIQAVQWTGDNHTEVFQFCTVIVEEENGTRSVKGRAYTNNDGLQLEAGRNGESGWVTVPVEWWVARHLDDDLDYWPIDPDTIIKNYEAVAEIQ